MKLTPVLLLQIRAQIGHPVTTTAPSAAVAAATTVASTIVSSVSVGVTVGTAAVAIRVTAAAAAVAPGAKCQQCFGVVSLWQLGNLRSYALNSADFGHGNQQKTNPATDNDTTLRFSP